MSSTTIEAKRILPLGRKVLVKRDEAKDKTKGGIVIPDNSKDKPKQGTVIEAGPGETLENGILVKPQVKKDDRIIFSQYAGTEIKLNGVAFLIIEDGDILCTVEEGAGEVE